MTAENLDAYIGAYGEAFPFADENVGMLNAYAGYFLESIGSRRDVDVLSLGIGYQTVSERIVRELADRLASYAILEGSRAVIEAFDAQWTLDFEPELIETYFEDFDTARKFDAIEMGFVLEHVDDPAAILRRFAPYLKIDGVIGMAVPNARSLHRLIGHAAGLLDDVYRLSRYDLELGHKRYFDVDSFTRLAESAGLIVARTRGIMLKPVTTAQLAQLELSPDIVAALYTVGDELPAIANAIYIEAKAP